MSSKSPSSEETSMSRMRSASGALRTAFVNGWDDEGTRLRAAVLAAVAAMDFVIFVRRSIWSEREDI